MNVWLAFWRGEMMKSQMNEFFYCEHLTDSEEHKRLIDSFKTIRAEGAGLEYYLKCAAIEDELSDVARTYLVRDVDSGELVAYFTLKAGSITVNEKRRFLATNFDSIPGIELTNFAVNGSYKEVHREMSGIGHIVLYYFVKPMLQEVAGMIGANIFYIFALPYKALLKHYMKMNFVRLDKKTEKKLHRRMKPRYDERCIFMYQLIA